MAERSPKDLARPLRTSADLAPLLERVRGARFVLLGEASHGTHEHYGWRTEITKRLVEELGFRIVAVEGDWPDCSAVDSWVRRGDRAGTKDAVGVLRRFDRWPRWMWANEEVAALITWMRAHNTTVPESAHVGFYGLDVYSLWESLRAVLAYLHEHEPSAVAAARQAFRCFEPYGEDPQAYARATRLVPTSCEEEVLTLLERVRAQRWVPREGDEERFDLEQNAAVAREAERYYRAMVLGGPEAWNVRDIHMADTLDRLMEHHSGRTRAIVWAHNTHVGDARATDMADAGMTNLGQLVRERHADQGVVVVGLSAHRGEVIAADAWGAGPRRMAVPPAREGSLEALLHHTVGDDALYVFPARREARWLEETRLQRAIGVVYDSAQEQRRNYVPTVPGDRYDALLAFESTRAVRPLRRQPGQSDELETAPFGF